MVNPFQMRQYRSRKQTEIDQENEIMKRNRWQGVAFVGVLLTAATAVGQSGRVVEADIPFRFVVAGHTLPAGHYAVSIQGEQAIRITNSHKQAAFVLSFNVEGRTPDEGTASLVFNRYGDKY